MSRFQRIRGAARDRELEDAKKMEEPAKALLPPGQGAALDHGVEGNQGNGKEKGGMSSAVKLGQDVDEEGAPEGLDGSEKNNGGTSAAPVAAPRQGFQPGQSGNPAGRPIGSKNKATLMAQKAQQMLFEGMPDAIKMLQDIAAHDPSKTARLEALKILTTRGIPRAPVSLEISGPDGGAPIKVYDIDLSLVLPRQKAARPSKGEGEGQEGEA